MARLLLWSPNYAPELTGIPPLVTDAAEWLAGRGHDVHVVAAVPNYPERKIHAGYRGRLSFTERRGGVGLDRAWLRVRPGESFRDKVAYELSFAACSFPAVARRLGRTDVLVCLVPTLATAPVAAGAVGALRALGRAPRFVLWIQDLVLLAAAAVRDLGPRAERVVGAAGAVEAWSVRRADRVVVCSPGFERYLDNLGVDPSRIDTVYNWVDTGRIDTGPLPDRDGPTRFLYSGNLGYTQGFETLLGAAGLLPPGIEIELVGEGNAAGRVRALAAPIQSLAVRPPVPSDEFPSLLASADVHLVLQRRVGAGANFPSKIASYLASGRPVIASVSPDTPAAATLRESGAALVVEPESPAALAEAMATLHADPELRAALGARGRQYAEERFERTRALAELELAFLG